MNTPLRNLELVLTFASLAAILGTAALVTPQDPSAWQTVAAMAAAACVMQGLVGWGVRRRQQRIRDAALASAQLLLARLAAQQQTMLTGPDRRNPTAAEISRLVTAVSDELHAVSSGRRVRARTPGYPESGDEPQAPTPRA
jgi:hypothetical protein